MCVCIYIYKAHAYICPTHICQYISYKCIFVYIYIYFSFLNIYI